MFKGSTTTVILWQNKSILYPQYAAAVDSLRVVLIAEKWTVGSKNGLFSL